MLNHGGSEPYLSKRRRKSSLNEGGEGKKEIWKSIMEGLRLGPRTIEKRLPPERRGRIKAAANSFSSGEKRSPVLAWL